MYIATDSNISTPNQSLSRQACHSADATGNLTS
jgi:hypothetical protein